MIEILERLLSVLFRPRPVIGTRVDTHFRQTKLALYQEKCEYAGGEILWIKEGQPKPVYPAGTAARRAQLREEYP